ncbi:UNVERIFIED_ORG: hypothetical protein QE415_006001 [Bacillus thuringiensis]|nr:hypothetical protein [Bacillus thuringiensis]
MMINKAYKFRIYPNQAQAILIKKNDWLLSFCIQSLPISMG